MGIGFAALVGLIVSYAILRNSGSSGRHVLGIALGACAAVLIVLVAFQINYPLGMTTSIRNRALETYMVWGGLAAIVSPVLGAMIARVSRASRT